MPEPLPALDDPRLRLRLLPTLDGSPSRLSSSSSSSSSEPGEEEELFDEKLIPTGGGGGGAAAAAGVVADPDTAAGAITAALGLGENIPTPGGAWGILIEEIGIALLIKPPMPIPVETGEITGLMVVAVVVAGGTRKEAEVLLPVALLLAAELWRASSSLKNL